MGHELHWSRHGLSRRRRRRALAARIAALDALCAAAIEEFRPMALNGRLGDKFRAARSLTKEARDRAEARLDALLARRKQIKDLEDRAFEPHETLLDGLEQELQAVEDEMRQMANDPLAGSGS